MGSKTFCSALWTHQTIDGIGRVKPCCRFIEDFRPKQHDLNFYTIEEIFNSDFQKSLRQKSLNGELIEGCRRCYEEENNNKTSLRMRLNDYYKIKDDIVSIDGAKLEYLEIGLSNHCNLKCRICDSRYSHKIYDDEVEYYKKSFSPTKFTNVSTEHIYSHLSQLKFIKFTGGEPLIMKECLDILQKAKDLGYSKNIKINFTTNCTVFPKDEIINLWREFDHVELILSLDSIVKEENEYQRYQTKQDIVLSNIEKFLDLRNHLNISMIARPTVSIFTAYHLPETLEWLNSKNLRLNPIHLTHPIHINLTVLPVDQKKIIEEKYKSFNYSSDIIKYYCDYILNYMYSEDNSHLVWKFKDHTNFLDKKRNQSFKDVYYYYSF
jgi:molybdenum cofactor biosynthesis enzyme MoaA